MKRASSTSVGWGRWGVLTSSRGAMLVALVAGCGADTGPGPGRQGPAGGAGGDESPPVNGAAGGGALPGAGGVSTAPGAGGDLSGGGGAAPAPPITPSNITFDWPEDTGAAGPPCRAGRYVGRFEGMYTSPATFVGVPIPVDGDIDFTLMESQQGEFFEITDGFMVGMANNTYPFSAEMIGTLDCPMGILRDAGLRNGVYTVGNDHYAFEGPLNAVYDRPTSSFTAGTWTVIEPGLPPGLLGDFGGSGTWQAVHVP